MYTEKLLLSWDDIHADIEHLRHKCSSENLGYDWVIGITVGGLIPLALIAKALETRNVTTISAHSYDNTNTRGALKIEVLPQIELEGKRILLIDEIADSGVTLHTIREHLQNTQHPEVVHTATLCMREDRCKFPPDMYARVVHQWVVFPWDAS